MKSLLPYADRSGAPPTVQASSINALRSSSSSSTITATTSNTSSWTGLLPSLHVLPRVSSSSPPPSPSSPSTDTLKAIYARLAAKLRLTKPGPPRPSSSSGSLRKAQRRMPAAIRESDGGVPVPVRPTKPIRLSAWDQAAMRGYIRVCLCFPFDHSRRVDAVAHLRASLARLAQQRPDFAGTLETRAGGIVYLHKGPRAIPLLVEDLAGTFAYASYDKLKAAGFPPGAFVGPHFDQPCAMGEGLPPVPVSVIKVFFIPGGLVLGTYFCHAFADGNCLRIFLECLSAQTRGLAVDLPSNKRLNAPFANDCNPSTSDNADLEPLIRRAPEYAVLPGPTGPTQPRLRPGGRPMHEIERIGKLFVFQNARLDELREQIAGWAPCEAGGDADAANGGATTYGATDARPPCRHTNGQSCYISGSDSSDGRKSSESLPTARKPSKYTCIAGLTFRGIVKARLAEPAEAQHYPYTPGVDDVARLQTMVNWTGRAFADANPDYFGNATAVAVTEVSCHPDNSSILLGRACSSSSSSTEAAAASDLETLSQLVYKIEQTIASVDEAFVTARTEMFSRISDPRRIGLEFDPRTPQDLGFNTWRFFGAETYWTIPGVPPEKPEKPTADGQPGSARPDVLRRMQDVWNMAGALILPARHSSPVHELLVTLPVTAMERLCNDPDFMQWVDHVIG